MAYDGLRDLLADYNLKLNVRWENRAVRLSVVPNVDYTETPIDGDTANLTVEQYTQKTNHLICLGKGELTEREVFHLYVDQFGRIGDVQYYFGTDEFAATYENTNAETSEDLRNDAIKRLKELRKNDKAEIILPTSADVTYDIGDLVGASDVASGVSVVANVSKKIVKIKNGAISTEYKTGG